MGFKARNGQEKDLVPFKDVTYPMDMSAEQKSFDLGGACKVKKFFCVKCACNSEDTMSFWEGGDSSHKCAHSHCGDQVRCHHFEVDAEEELDRKRVQLSCMICGNVDVDVDVDGDGDVLERKHIEELVASETEMVCDPAVMNKTTDPRHIDFVLNGADQILKSAFIAQVNKEFRMRGWISTHTDGGFMTIKQKVSK